MKRGAYHQARRVGAVLLLATACPPSPDATSSATEVLETTQSYDTYTSTASSSGGSTLPSSTTTDTSDPTSATTSPTTDTTLSSTSDDSDATTDDTTDSDTSSGTTGQQVQSCKKVDIVLFVDNHGVMAGVQYGLHTMLPHLADRIENEFADWDYHMMVVTGDPTWGDEFCEQRCEQGGDPCETPYAPYPCEAEPVTCDETLGAGINYPVAGYASNVPCPIDGDKRYVSTGQSNLADTLECMATVGYGYTSPGKHEIVRAVLDSIDEPLNAPGACNDGFLRDDAYLILFVISPLPDIYATGTPAEWTAELKGHKGGKFDKIWFIGLFEACDIDFGKIKYEPLKEWVSSLYHHALGHTCTEDMIQYIDPALDYIQGDCQE